jgi:hypothetical protein
MIPALSTATLAAQNTMVCTAVPTGSLIVKKQAAYPFGVAVNQNFPVTVTCGSTVTHLNLVDGGSQTVSNIPLNTSCSVVEGTIQTPPNFCPGNTTPVWTTVYVPPSPITITGTGITETVGNTLRCVAVQPSPCVLDPGMVAAGNTFARRVTLAQTFTPTQSGTLATITHGLETISGSVANYNLLVTTTVGGLPSWTGGLTTTPNVLLAMTGVTVFSNSAQVNGVVPIPAGQQPHLNAGTLYALILIPGTPTSGFMAWRGNSSAGSYPNGSAYELNGTTWTVPGTGPKDHGFKLDGQCP